MEPKDTRKRKYRSGINFKEQRQQKVYGQQYKNRKGEVVTVKKPPELD